MVYVLKNKMEKLDKTIKYTQLFNIYKSLLSNAQQEMINDYFFLDLSMSEIAENRGISKAAVDDAISKGINKLDELESELKILEKRQKVQLKLDKLKEKALNTQEVEEILEIEKELDYGI